MVSKQVDIMIFKRLDWELLHIWCRCINIITSSKGKSGSLINVIND